MKLAGKIALVTGSSRGIGQAIALELARQGADVVVNYRQGAAGAAKTVADIESLGRRAVAVPANLGNPDDINRMFDALEQQWGGLDILVCNAATGMPGPLLTAPIKAWDLAMNVNARSVLLCAQRAFPLMKARGGGRIITLTSVLGVEQAAPEYGPIAVSKAAIHALTVYLAAEFGPHNIITNAIGPGIVETRVLDIFKAGPDARTRAHTVTPSGRITTPEDVAYLAAFLCSDEAHQINGQIIEIDGGYRRLFS
ncbi:MAG: SDR family oxidoreductase [Chloroflexi bacterium]|nr:SDR family oxidoreductase [Chloroflexota bacterium]